MKKIKSSILSVAALSVLSTACLKVEADLPFKSDKNQSSSKAKKSRVSNKSTSGSDLIGDDQVSFRVLSEKEFQMQMLAGTILGANSADAMKMLEKVQRSSPAKSIANTKMKMMDDGEESLLVAIPIGLLGQENIFGGVITKVTDKTNESLGGLKLTDLSPLHVRTMVSAPGGQLAITLVGCASACTESSKQSGLINLPIKGVDQKENTVIVDLAPIGQELDLISMMDPEGEYTQLRAVSSSTTNFEYDVSTLVFDIKTSMIPVDTKPEDVPTANKTDFTVRWYLKLSSGFNSYFESRTPTEGVGFFKTERSKTPKITRFSATDYGKTVKYYIKNVPEEWKSTFGSALDNWNKEFKKIIDRELLSYEFVDATDPKAALLVPGDIRYNIIEWDLENIASYGGLGPSIANQSTGETISANVLIQGPTIISLYTKWFALSQNARALLADGKTHEANKIVADFNKEASAILNARNAKKYALKLGAMDMTVHAQKADLQDPMIKNHFEIVPANITFENYMKGYFAEMLQHELGHNMGLRHNFKGNLGAYESEDKGSVSRSIMEYLGRPYRYKSAIGLYDKMAIAYGYTGKAPTHLNWFCTDEDQGTDKATLVVKSPECTKSDATSDPFSFWEERLARAIDLAVDTKSTSAPVWKTSEIQAQIEEAVIGLTAYAASAEKTMSTWTNFFGKGNRPEDAAGIKAYVLEAIKKKICAPELANIIAAKESAEAKELAQKNLDELKKVVSDKALEVAVYTAEQTKCE